MLFELIEVREGEPITFQSGRETRSKQMQAAKTKKGTLSL